MILLVSGATRTMREIDDPRLGELMRPGNGNRPTRKLWAIDNGAFAGFDAGDFVRLLDRLKDTSGCLWVACPDEFADSVTTAVLFREWAPKILGRGLPVAFVLQDGCSDVPWDDCSALFVGGSTEYKLSPEALCWSHKAKIRGKSVHVGRVNSVRRMRAAHAMAADSIDGTRFSRFGDRWIQWGLDWIRDVETQPPLSLFPVTDTHPSPEHKP